MKGMPSARKKGRGSYEANSPATAALVDDVDVMTGAAGSNHGPSNDHAAGPTPTPGSSGVAVNSLVTSPATGEGLVGGGGGTGQAPYPPMTRRAPGTNQPNGPRGAPLFAPHSNNGGQISGRYRKIGG